MTTFLPSRQSASQVFTGDAKGAALMTDARGFTPTDLEVLDRMRIHALRNSSWARAEFVRDASLDCLAAWNGDAAQSESPSVAIIRFKKSGTYALTLGSTLIATDRSLARILTSIQCRFGTSAPLTVADWVAVG